MCCGSSEETFVTAKRKFTISRLLSPRSLVAFLVGLLSCQLAEPGWNDKACEFLHIEKPSELRRSYLNHAIDALRQRGNHLRRTHIAERGGEATISLGQREHPKITQRNFTMSRLLSPRSRVVVLVGLLSCH